MPRLRWSVGVIIILPLYYCESCQQVFGRVPCEHQPAAKVEHVGYGAITGAVSTSERQEREQEGASRAGWRKFGATTLARREG
jgi:hypothetical protein